MNSNHTVVHIIESCMGKGDSGSKGTGWEWQCLGWGKVDGDWKLFVPMQLSTL